MASAWPPVITAGTYIASNASTLVWGTDGFWGSYIVKSIRSTDVVENIYIENGTGIRAKRIQLWQGREVDITVVDDTAMTIPKPGTSVSFKDPISKETFAFKVINNDYNAARKQEGERVLRCECMWAIDNSGNVANGGASITP